MTAYMLGYLVRNDRKGVLASCTDTSSAYMLRCLVRNDRKEGVAHARPNPVLQSLCHNSQNPSSPWPAFRDLHLQATLETFWEILGCFGTFQDLQATGLDVGLTVDLA
jgi:hypothetical protein